MLSKPRFISQTAAFLARRAHLIALALLAAVGLATFNDYAGSVDEEGERNIGLASFNYILGDEDALIDKSHRDRYYGVAFQIPLIAAERALGLTRARQIHLMRSPAMHIFFLICGFFAWLLAYRLFGNRLVALLAMLIFLLHPRIYAHSFFNPKDPAFLGAFMVALYLIHRAFRRDSVWAFALCGAGVGLLTNIRVLGVMPFAAVLGMLALDVFHALRRGGWGGAKPILANAAAFSLAAVLTLYAAWPILWRDPLAELADAFATMARFPIHYRTLFRGEWIHWPNIPWDYIPAWILITTPPAFLALSALGIFAAVRLCASRWRGMFANSTARFGLMTLACAILPVAAAIALNSNLYGGWRQMYFLYAPLSVLAAFGLAALAAIRKPRLRLAALALAAVGICVAVAEMVALHPHQSAYFTPLANRASLAERWRSIDAVSAGFTEALRALLNEFPNRSVRIADSQQTRDMIRSPAISREAKSRAEIVRSFPEFLVVRSENAGEGEDVFLAHSAYGAPIVSVVDKRAESETAYRAAYARSRLLEPAASAGGFKIYRDADAILYIKEPCDEGDADADARFRLSIFRDGPDEPPRRTETFDFHRYGAAFDGKCLMSYPLPDRFVGAAATARLAADRESELWSAAFRFPENAVRKAALAKAATAPLPDKPAARADFNLYLELDGRTRTLTYVKSPCAESDARGRFYLSIFPADPSDVEDENRARGLAHNALNFDFDQHGAIFGGKCVIVRDLPDYRIAAIETGRFADGAGELWGARIAVGE